MSFGARRGVSCGAIAAGILLVLAGASGTLADGPQLLAGLASRDVTPEEPVWLSGYAARNHASTGVDGALYAEALVLGVPGGGRVAIVALDNCEVSGEFTAPILEKIEERFGLPARSVVIVSSHTHSGPVLADTLPGMFALEGEERERVRRYSERLARELVDVVGAAVSDLAPARLSHGTGRAGFGMNRRVYGDRGVRFGENPEGPVDHDVPVLKVTGPDGTLRGIVFGYACHGTTVGGSDANDFYAVSGDYPGYAREYLREVYPGVPALFLTGLCADINPSPRGKLVYARQHGLELAGAVVGVLNRPMRPIGGSLRATSDRVELPLEAQPAREKIEEDARSDNPYIRNRARRYLSALDAGTPHPDAVGYPVTVVRIGDALTWVFLAGEVVVDYSHRLERELRLDHPWLVGYAMEVPCYIPTRRILREGGYEAEDSLIYYGLYGPFRPEVEEVVVSTVKELVSGVRVAASR